MLDASANSWKTGGVQTGRQIRGVEEPSHVVVFTDSDHAGCLKTRESTPSSKLFYNSHMLRSTSTTQGVIALRSGESGKDLGVDISKNTKIDRAVLEVRVDASAGRGIAVRLGFSEETIKQGSVAEKSNVWTVGGTLP